MSENDKLGWQLGRKGTVFAVHPRIDAIAVGIHRLLGICRKQIIGGDRGLIKTHGAQPDIAVYGGFAKHFRQAALGRQPHHFHLPEPILRMGKAQPGKNVFDAGSGDVRHTVIHRVRL